MSSVKDTKKFTLPRVHHVGTVVKDLDASIKYYSESFGLGPFNVSESSRSGALIRGKSGNYKLRQAFAEMGQTLLELSEVVEGRPIQKEFLEKNGEGVHHLGFVVEDLDVQVAELQKRGFKVIQKYDSPPGGLRFAFLDTNKVGGIVFEFVWLPEGMR